MNREDMPPKPPRYPPGLVNRSFAFNVFMNVFAFGLNAYLAYGAAKDGSDWRLFGSCAAMTLTTYAFYIVVRRVREDLREWDDLRRKWDELNAYFEQRGKQ